MSDQVHYYIAAISATVVKESGFRDEMMPIGFWHHNAPDAQKLAYNFCLRRFPAEQGYVNHAAASTPTDFVGDGYPTTLGQLLDVIPNSPDGQVTEFNFTLNLFT